MPGEFTEVSVFPSDILHDNSLTRSRVTENELSLPHVIFRFGGHDI
jgi:hypothetical protein